MVKKVSTNTEVTLSLSTHLPLRPKGFPELTCIGALCQANTALRLIQMQRHCASIALITSIIQDNLKLNSMVNDGHIVG